MGQRRQHFVIARINGRYRTLAAVHHQWLYGQTALRRCRSTLELLQHSGSYMPLTQELIAAASHDEAFWDSLNPLTFQELLAAANQDRVLGDDSGYTEIEDSTEDDEDNAEDDTTSEDAHSPLS